MDNIFTLFGHRFYVGRMLYKYPVMLVSIISADGTSEEEAHKLAGQLSSILAPDTIEIEHTAHAGGAPTRYFIKAVNIRSDVLHKAVEEDINGKS